MSVRGLKENNVEVNGSSLRPSRFEPCCLASLIGSLPHTDVVRGTRLMFEHTPEIPSWVQFPRKSPSEKMLRQFSEGIPGLIREDECDLINTELPDYLNQVMYFYRNYLAAMEEKDVRALDAFALSPSHAAGFHEFIRQLPECLARKKTVMLKGQVTGPITLGINILDQDLRCSYYDEQVRDILVKTAALKAVWQIRELQRFRLPVMVFIDEPSLLLMGKSLFLTIDRRDVIHDLNEVASAIHACGGLAGVHCEENTDWSMLMAADLDLLDFDAYDHFQALTLYPQELKTFLKRGGCLGWGLVPTLDQKAAAGETVPSLLERFERGLEQLTAIVSDRDLLLRRSLITPSCGAGGVLDETLAERALGLLRDLSLTIRRRYGLP